MPTTVWVTTDVLEWVEDEAGRAFPNETGGVLMGWHRPERDEFVVVHAVGPGSGSVHESHRFEPDNRHHVEAVGDVYQRSGRKVTYLGDWHTHPLGTTSLSWTDRRTLGGIASHEPSRCPEPLMFVLGGSPDVGWDAQAHAWVPRRLWRWQLPGSEVLRLRSWEPAVGELADIGYPYR